MPVIWLQRLPDGSYFDWGRHGPGIYRRPGAPARLYTGEAARVLDLVLRHSTP